MHNMRRSEREVSGNEALGKIIQKCTVCRLAISDEPAPYIVPMNFGYDYEDGRLTLYFHCARNGRKLDLIEKNPVCGFEMDNFSNVMPAESPCDYYINYESIIGSGRVSKCEGDEKMHGLTKLMSHYSDKKDFSFSGAELPVTTVLKLEVSEFKGKRIDR